MMKQALMTLVLCSTLQAFAAGGMIGGGEVNFKPLMKCNASSIDPTHSGSPMVQIVKEVDYDGLFIPNSTLRIVTYDDQFKPVRYYVTHETELSVSPDNSYSLAIWAYGIGSDGNEVIGNFQWDGYSRTGSLSSSDVGDVEELDLSSCKMTP